MLNYEQAKELKDAGFPQDDTSSTHSWNDFGGHPELVVYPTLSELIEACGEEFESLTYFRDEDGSLWHADSQGEIRPDLDGERCVSGCCGKHGKGVTPEEAVARLWLTLNKK